MRTLTHRPRSWRALLAVLVLALVAVLVPAGGAAQAAPPSRTASAPEPSADGPTVTLVTGDEVTLGPQRGGRPTVGFRSRHGQAGAGGFRVQHRDGDVYVMPDDVASLVPGLLDPALFDVTSLVAMGYDDAHRGDVPLIVQRADGVRTLAATGMRQRRALDSIGADAATVAKSGAPAFGDQLAGLQDARRRARTAASPLGGVRKIWLDGRMSAADLDGYLTQVGAPGARAGARDGDFYRSLSGTSQPTPIVAGAAALLLREHPGWTWERVKAAVPERYDLSVQVLDRNGDPYAGGTVWLVDGDTGHDWDNVALDDAGEATLRLPPGHYSVFSTVTTPASGDRPASVTFGGTAELHVDKDMTYVLDAGKALQVRPPEVSGQPTTATEFAFAYGRHGDSGIGITDYPAVTLDDVLAGKVFLMPSVPVTAGDAKAAMRWRLEPTGHVHGGAPDTYDLLYVRPALGSGLWPRLSRRDVNRMAREDETFPAVSGPATYALGQAYSLLGTAIIYYRPITVPAHRVSLMTAEPEATWYHLVFPSSRSRRCATESTCTGRVPGTRRHGRRGCTPR